MTFSPGARPDDKEFWDVHNWPTPEQVRAHFGMKAKARKARAKVRQKTRRRAERLEKPKLVCWIGCISQKKPYSHPWFAACAALHWKQAPYKCTHCESWHLTSKKPAARAFLKKWRWLTHR